MLLTAKAADSQGWQGRVGCLLVRGWAGCIRSCFTLSHVPSTTHHMTHAPPPSPQGESFAVNPEQLADMLGPSGGAKLGGGRGITEDDEGPRGYCVRSDDEEGSPRGMLSSLPGSHVWSPKSPRSPTNKARARRRLAVLLRVVGASAALLRLAQHAPFVCMPQLCANCLQQVLLQLLLLLLPILLLLF